MSVGSPKISVIMPVYNAETYLREAIESIQNQTFTNFEFIIVDDRSTDKSYEIIKKYAKSDDRIVVLKNDENLKLSKTLNRAIKISKGKYILRMDADDISLPYRLKKQFDYMEDNPEIGISGGTMQIVNAKGIIAGQRKYHLRHEEIHKNIYHYSPFSHPATIIRKAVLDKAGLYDYEFNPAEDYELYFRIGKYSKFGNLPDTLIKYRLSQKSMTKNSLKKMALKTIDIRRKYSMDNDYKMSLFDKMYTSVQYYFIKLIPFPNLLISLFNLMRNK